MSKKATIRGSAKVNVYNVLEQAVEDGVAYGLSRRCIQKLGLLKCSGEQEAQAVEIVTQAVMNSLCEWLTF